MSVYFLGGVHGAGKTKLAQALAASVGAVAVSASHLIRTQGVTPSTRDKRVFDL